MPPKPVLDAMPTWADIAGLARRLALVTELIPLCEQDPPQPVLAEALTTSRWAIARELDAHFGRLL